jgi:hypothetical protein
MYSPALPIMMSNISITIMCFLLYKGFSPIAQRPAAANIITADVVILTGFASPSNQITMAVSRAVIVITIAVCFLLGGLKCNLISPWNDSHEAS